jgi:hypothetical protein
LILLAGTALAATLDSYENIIIVGEHAPAADVVIGANFAASMKATSGTVFQSSLDTDAYEQLTDLDDKTIVVINGEQDWIRIIGSGTLADQAEQYFEDQGFDVQMITNPTRGDLLVAVKEDNQNSPSQTETPENNEQSKPEPTEQAPQSPIISPQAQEIGNQERNENQGNMTVEPKQPNVVVRIWHWFAGLF